MAVFLGAKGGDIISTRSVSNLLSGMKESLTGKMAYLLSGEDVALYSELKDRVNAELGFDQEFSGRFERQVQELATVEYADQLPALYHSLVEMTKEHFARRGSVIAFHSLGTVIHDQVLRKSLELSQLPPDPTSGAEPASFCLMANGRAGRAEVTLARDSSYFIIYQGSPDAGAEIFEKFRYRLMAIMKLCGLVGADNRHSFQNGLWLGTVDNWKDWVLAQVKQRENLGESLAALADLRNIGGDEALGGMLKAFATESMVRHQRTEAFVTAIKKLSFKPVALGIFGSFRTSRSGKHRGEFNLEDEALVPLVMNIRILAVHYGLMETGTIDRIKTLLNNGRLGVDLADRLLKAYHVFTSQRIRLELKADINAPHDFYLDPDQLSEDEEYLVKGGLEAVVNLQKIVYQVFSEQG